MKRFIFVALAGALCVSSVAEAGVWELFRLEASVRLRGAGVRSHGYGYGHGYGYYNAGELFITVLNPVTDHGRQTFMECDPVGPGPRFKAERKVGKLLARAAELRAKGKGAKAGEKEEMARHLLAFVSPQRVATGGVCRTRVVLYTYRARVQQLVRLFDGPGRDARFLGWWIVEERMYGGGYVSVARAPLPGEVGRAWDLTTGR